MDSDHQGCPPTQMQNLEMEFSLPASFDIFQPGPLVLEWDHGPQNEKGKERMVDSYSDR